MEETRTQQQMREARAATQPQGERQAIEEATQIHEELAALNPNIEIDAKEFGEHVRNGGWRLGLLVARSAMLGEIGGDKGNQHTGGIVKIDNGKISMNSFARQAGGISRNTVKKYIDAWDMASDDGHVPSSSSLSPGQPFEFDDEIHTPELWKSYFKPPTGEEKDPFVTQVNKVNSVGNIDTSVFSAENFDAQMDFSIDDVHAAALTMVRVGNEIMSKCIAAATALNHQINVEGVDG